jgi:hypothetical protein
MVHSREGGVGHLAPVGQVKHLLGLLRFLNLLEPGRPIVSITKTAMWVCVVGIALAIFTGRPLDLVTISAFYTTSALYAWRRYVQWKTGKVLGDTEYADPQPAPPRTE